MSAEPGTGSRKGGIWNGVGLDLVLNRGNQGIWEGGEAVKCVRIR